MAIQNVSPDVLKIKRTLNFRKDNGDLNQLAQDIIDEGGITEPLLVVSNNDGSTFTVIDGERRLKAAKTAMKKGLKTKTIPIVVEEIDSEADQILMKMAGVASVNGLRMTPTEEAAVIKHLIEDHLLSARDVSRRLKLDYNFNMTTPTALDRLRLLEGSDRLKHAVDYEEYPVTIAKMIIMSHPGDFETQDKMVEDTVIDKKARKELIKQLSGVTSLFTGPALAVTKYAKKLKIDVNNIDDFIEQLTSSKDEEVLAALNAGMVKGIMGALGSKVSDPFKS